MAEVRIDICNWKWIEHLSSYNRNVYYDTSSGEWFLEACDEDSGDYLYYKSGAKGEECKYLGYTDHDGSLSCVSAAGKCLVLDPSVPT